MKFVPVHTHTKSHKILVPKDRKDKSVDKLVPSLLVRFVIHKADLDDKFKTAVA